MHMHVIFANNPLQYLYILHITYLDDQTSATSLYISLLLSVIVLIIIWAYATANQYF